MEKLIWRRLLMTEYRKGHFGHRREGGRKGGREGGREGGRYLSFHLERGPHPFLPRVLPLPVAVVDDG